MDGKRWQRVFLVRHGQVAGNREFRYVGARDEPLTDVGEAQAAALGASLRAQPIARVVSSPLLRTRATAAAIADAVGATVEVEPRLREQAFGEWEGLTREEVLALGDSHGDVLRQFDRDPTTAPPAGEALEDVRQRATRVVEEACADPQEGAVVLVSHVGPIKALVASALRLTLQQVRPFFLDPASVTVVDWGSPSFLRLFNSPATIQWDEVRWASKDAAPAWTKAKT